MRYRSRSRFSSRRRGYPPARRRRFSRRPLRRRVGYRM